MSKASRFAAFLSSILDGRVPRLARLARPIRNPKAVAIGVLGFALLGAPRSIIAQTDCLACHSDKSMQDAAGRSISVDGGKFGSSVHGSLH